MGGSVSVGSSLQIVRSFYQYFEFQAEQHTHRLVPMIEYSDGVTSWCGQLDPEAVKLCWQMLGDRPRDWEALSRDGLIRFKYKQDAMLIKLALEAL